MTDKQHDTQKAAGELQGRAHNRHTEQATGTRQETHGSHGTHNRQQERRTSGGKEGRREEHGWPRAWGAEEGSTAAGREQREQTDRKKYVIYLRERRREKTPPRLAKACKHCIYISLNIVAWWLFIALSFIYIKGVYCIYIIYIIYPRLMFTFLLKLMCI